MLAARRLFLLVCLLLASLLSLFLIRATSHAQPSTSGSPSIISAASIPHPRGVAIDTAQGVKLENPGWIATIASVPKARGVTTDTNGNLYALATDAGAVYKIAPGGQISTIADLPDISGGYIGPVFDSASGNLFVGKYALGTGNEVLKITLAGVVSVFATVAAPSGLAADGQGNLFVTSYTCPDGAVYKISSTGVVSLFGTGLCHPDGVAIGPNGDLFIGDRGTQRIIRVPAAGGAATVFATGFTTPIAVAFDQTGTLFVADYTTGTISSVDANGVVSPFASRLLSPSGLVFDQQNQLYVANSYTDQVVKLTNPAPNIAIIAGFTRPRGITTDTDGNLYTIAADDGTVYKITPGGQISVITDLPDFVGGYIGPVFDPASGNLFVGKNDLGAGNQVLKITPDGAVSVFATVAAPSGLAADGQGNLFVTSYTCPGGAVYKVSSTGVVSPFGTGLCHPDGVAIGPNGDLFIGDRGTKRIMRVPAAGGAASVFATGISIPIAVAFDQAGRLFATDYSTGTIYAIDVHGVISPFASGFYLPDGLVFGPENQLYVADFGNYKVVRVIGSKAPSIPGYTVTPFADVGYTRGVVFDNDGNLLTLNLNTGVVYSIDPAGRMKIVADLPDYIAGYAGPAFDPISGSIFVSQYFNQSGDKVLRIAPDGTVSVYASGIPVPLSMTTDGAGNLYVASYKCPGGVYKVTPAGVVSTYATDICLADGPTFRANGSLYIADRQTSQIKSVPPGGGAATVFASGFDIPTGMAFESQGFVLVANSNNGTITRVDPNGVKSPFGKDFTNPVALTFDHAGQIFIADLGASIIYKATPLGSDPPTATATPSPTATPIVSPTATPSPAATPTNVPPPIADRLTINGGALATTSVNVRLDVSASNAGGGQAGLSMSFSNDGTNWGDWQDYAASSLWQLTSGDGPKTVYGRFKNSAGAISEIVSDTIKLDTSVQPEYSITINDGALYTNKVAVQLKITARPRTAEMQVSNDGGFAGAQWEPYTTHKNWQLTRYNQQEITLLVFVRFRDVDGNVSSLYLDSIILDVNPPHGHVEIDGADQGTLLELAATDDVSGVAGMRVSAQPDFGDASWEPFASSRAWEFGTSSTVYVQFRDQAGNVSPSYTASLAGAHTVFLPFVRQ